jgi:quercetin dioxygenase-like cupin family protein
VLYVASGSGRVGNAQGEVAELAAGDIVYAPAGDSHWHGAGPNSYLMHISITTGGATVWEPRAVTDEEYDAGF